MRPNSVGAKKLRLKVARACHERVAFAATRDSPPAVLNERRRVYAALIGSRWLATGKDAASRTMRANDRAERIVQPLHARF